MIHRPSIIRVFIATLLLAGLAACSNTTYTGTVDDAKNSATLMFYNTENLFDTIDDPVKDDNDFLPDGAYRWTSQRYNTKLDRLGEVISGISDDFPAIVGLSEVENLAVLEDLVNIPVLKKANYQAVLIEGPDKRGIDVGLLYSKKKFKEESAVAIQVDMPEGERPTRSILHVTGRFKGGPQMHIFVNHWPSRYGGQEQSEPKRLAAAKALRDAVQSVQAKDPAAYIVCMGDFNDYPDNKSLSEVLDAGDLEAPGLLVNLMKDLPAGKGSYNYRGQWGYLDQFLVSKTLVDGLVPDVLPAKTGVYHSENMVYTNPESGEQYPSRTYGRTEYYGGYSDHYPIKTVLKY